MKGRRFELKFAARLTLFLVSYLPLFIIMIFSQVYNNKDYLYWGGMSFKAVNNFIVYFGFSVVLVFMTIFGIVGLFILLRNIERRSRTGGTKVKIIEVENKNSESISYLFTYLIPFVFQDLSSLTDVFAVLVLFFVTFIIYSNSSMLLVNPTISMWYSLYGVKYVGSDCRERNGLVISRIKFLEEDDEIKIRNVGSQLYYAVELRSRYDS